jgi:hypothetical protein
MMRVVENKGQSSDDLGLLIGSNLSVSANSLVARDVYHELAEADIQNPDLIDQLNLNIDRLSDLQARMQFMIRELRTLMKV